MMVPCVWLLVFGLAMADIESAFDDSVNFQNAVKNVVSPFLSEIENRVKHLELLRTEDAKLLSSMQHEIVSLKTENRRLNDKLSSIMSAEVTSSIHDNDTTTPSNHQLGDLVSINALFKSQGDTKVKNLNNGTNSRSQVAQSLLSTMNQDRIKRDDKTRQVRTVSPQIAFHVRLNHQLDSPGNEHAIAFDHVLTNIGNAYNKFTGVFTSPHSGLYVFSWSVMVQLRHEMTTELVKNGVPIASTYTCNYYYSNDNTGFAISQVNVNDVVWVRVHSHATGTNILPEFTQFSAFNIS